jgi:hypothetical protein
MARTTLARGKKPSQKRGKKPSQKRGKKPSRKTGRVTQEQPQPAPSLVTIDFISGGSLRDEGSLKEELPQSVVFIVKTPQGPYPPTSDVMTFLLAATTPEMNVYVSMFTPPGKGLFPYKVFWSSTPGRVFPDETKTANGSIEVSGGGDEDGRLKGRRRNAGRRRASRSTRR